MKTNLYENKRYPIGLLILFAILILTILLSMLLGRYPIDIQDVISILAGKVSGADAPVDATKEALLLMHRLPRICIAILVGACLSCAGVAYQGVFQNPMAAPDILGASSGAAFGAALAILCGGGKTMTVLSAFLFSLLTVTIVIAVGSRTRGKRVLGFILTGIMVSSMVSSFTSFIKLVADPLDTLPAITYWLMGSLNDVSPKDIAFAAVPMLLGILPLMLLRWRINLLTLGEEEAKTLGINVNRLRIVIIIAATLLTAASVSVSGMIGWIGLIIPHMARRIIGDEYLKLLPFTLLMGGIFLLLVDDIARTALATEIPIGILTSLIGAPFLIYLILKDGDRA